MNEAIARMLARYNCNGLGDYQQALREILQEIALLGLWRGKFFEKAAFYGGTALRILYGLDRFSEDLDFSLLATDAAFDLSRYTATLTRELAAFGFDVTVKPTRKTSQSAIQSAFLNANTLRQMLSIEIAEEIVKPLHREQVLKIKLEVDTDPPPGFDTEARYLLQPIPFAVRTYTVPDLFAGKMHAILCRRWQTRIKGRDWYDFVWYVANHPRLRLGHLEQRMRQSGDWNHHTTLSQEAFQTHLAKTIESLDVNQARREVEPFLKEPRSIAIWSQAFFHDVAGRIEFV